jgi:hypothetical protein
MSDEAIVLDSQAYVRAKLEPVGSVFYIDKTIDKSEADKLVSNGVAHRSAVIDTLSAYIDDTA